MLESLWRLFYFNFLWQKPFLWRYLLIYLLSRVTAIGVFWVYQSLMKRMIPRKSVIQKDILSLTSAQDSASTWRRKLRPLFNPFSDVSLSYWIETAIKEGILFWGSIFFAPLAYGLALFSLLSIIQLLSSEIFTKYWPHPKILVGIRLGLGALIVVGIVGIALDPNDVLHWELMGCFLTGSLFFLIRRPFPKEADWDAFLSYFKRLPWNRIPHILKGIMLIGMLSLPIIIWTQAVPKTNEFSVTMRDGTHLRTRVYFPPRWDGVHRPVLLIRTPYNLDQLDTYVYSYVVLERYIVVTQDCRGLGKSEGSFDLFHHEARDGYDTVAWIGEQAWCDGNIASFGGSALAMTQYFSHTMDPPRLKTAVLQMGAGELYDYLFFRGGCFTQGLVEFYLPLIEAEMEIETLLTHPTKDAWYQNVSLQLHNNYESVAVHAIHIGGWYDLFAQGTIDAFMLYNNASSEARNRQVLIMGPWSHAFTNEHAELTYPDSKGLALVEEYIGRILAEGLEGIEIDWNNTPRCFYYMMGAPDGENSTIDFNHWRNATNWPLPITYQSWYMHSDLILNDTISNKAGQHSFLFDPRDPISYGGGTTLLERMGPYDQRPFFTNRTDLVQFTSAILTKPLEIAGQIWVQLAIQSNCTDTDFTATLMDVYPDGREMWLADGILKTRYREGFNESHLMLPSQSYNLSIDLWSTAYHFSPGHQIRLVISSSCYNKYAINPNSGNPVANTHPADLIAGIEPFAIANNTIICDNSTNLSCIWFPILS